MDTNATMDGGESGIVQIHDPQRLLRVNWICDRNPPTATSRQFAGDVEQVFALAIGDQNQRDSVGVIALQNRSEIQLHFWGSLLQGEKYRVTVPLTQISLGTAKCNWVP